MAHSEAWLIGCRRWQTWTLAAFALFAVASIALQNLIWFSAAAWVAGMLIRRDWKIKPSPANLPLLLLGGGLVVSSVLAGTLNSSFFGLRKAGLMVIFFLTAATVDQPLTVRRLINLFLSGATVCAVWSITAHLLGWDSGRVRSFSGDYMAAGGMYMLAAILVLSRVFFNRTAGRWVWLLPLGLIGTALVMTYTRSSWIGAGAAFVMLGLFKDWRLSVAGVLAVVAFLWLFPNNPVSQRVFSINSKHITSNVERRYMWDTGLKLLRDKPVLGYGVDNLSHYYSRYVHPEAIEQNPPHVHNTLLQLGLNGGLAAVLFFVFWAVALLRVGWTGWQTLHVAAPERAGEVLGLTAAWVAFLVNGLFEFNFGTAQVITIVFFLMGLLVSAASWPADKPDFSLPKKSKFLFLRPRFRGDIVLASAVPRLLKRDFPNAQADLLTEPGSAPAAAGESAWDSVLTLPRHDLRAWWSMVRTVRKRDYDVVVDLFGNPRTAQLALFSGARLKIGPKVKVWDVVFHLRTQADRPGPRPAWESYFDGLRTLGLKQLSLRPRWEVSPEDAQWATDFLRARRLQPRRFVGIFPGATHLAKRWPLERFFEVAQNLKERRNLRSVFVFGPLEKDLKTAYTQAAAKQRLCAEDLTPGQLAALWASAAAVLSNDAFPMHVGPAVGTPTIGLFGPGEPAVWFPYPEKSGHRALHAPPECWPCHKDVCKSAQCWQDLSTARVLAALEDVLGKKHPGKETGKHA